MGTAGNTASVEFLLREFNGRHGLVVNAKPIDFSFETEENYGELFNDIRNNLDAAYNSFSLAFEGEDLVLLTEKLCVTVGAFVSMAVAFGIPFDKAFIECLKDDYDAEKLREIIYGNTESVDS